MKLHANARACPHSRLLAVSGCSSRAGRSRRRPRPPRERAHDLEVVAPLSRGGRAGASGSFVRPGAVPLRIDEARVAVIAGLRRLRMTGAEIVETLAMPRSTVSG